jgi:hypothetical protein
MAIGEGLGGVLMDAGIPVSVHPSQNLLPWNCPTIHFERTKH